MYHPIGVFDSGYGGLTVLKEIAATLPQYDYLYLGDNARSPYGNRSFETVYYYTRECVQWFFAQGCSLVILACNTASAKALRTIQQEDLPESFPGKKVLGVIRPTTEMIGSISRKGAVGVLATTGTVMSRSYEIEIAKFYPEVKVFQEACPMWVPLIENDEYENPGADYFINKNLSSLLSRSPDIDTILLACTHYPLIEARIRSFLPDGITVLSQGAIVAKSLVTYLQRHNEVERVCSTGGTTRFFTTDAPDEFDNKGSKFFGAVVRSDRATL